jgi:hypothetical protein
MQMANHRFECDFGDATRPSAPQAGRYVSKEKTDESE